MSFVIAESSGADPGFLDRGFKLAEGGSICAVGQMYAIMSFVIAESKFLNLQGLDNISAIKLDKISPSGAPLDQQYDSY